MIIINNKTNQYNVNRFKFKYPCIIFPYVKWFLQYMKVYFFFVDIVQILMAKYGIIYVV